MNRNQRPTQIITSTTMPVSFNQQGRPEFQNVPRSPQVRTNVRFTNQINGPSLRQQNVLYQPARVSTYQPAGVVQDYQVVHNQEYLPPRSIVRGSYGYAQPVTFQQRIVRAEQPQRAYRQSPVMVGNYVSYVSEVDRGNERVNYRQEQILNEPDIYEKRQTRYRQPQINEGGSRVITKVVTSKIQVENDPMVQTVKGPSWDASTLRSGYQRQPPPAGQKDNGKGGCPWWLCLLLLCLAIIGLVLALVLGAANNGGNASAGNSPAVANPVAAAAPPATALAVAPLTNVSGATINGTTAVSAPTVVSPIIPSASSVSPTSVAPVSPASNVTNASAVVVPTSIAPISPAGNVSTSSVPATFVYNFSNANPSVAPVAPVNTATTAPVSPSSINVSSAVPTSSINPNFVYNFSNTSVAPAPPSTTATTNVTPTSTAPTQSTSSINPNFVYNFSSNGTLLNPVSTTFSSNPISAIPTSTSTAGSTASINPNFVYNFTTPVSPTSAPPQTVSPLTTNPLVTAPTASVSGTTSVAPTTVP